MNSWPMKRMSELTRLVTDGKHGDCDEESDSGYFFLSSKDLRDGKLHYDNPRQIKHADFLETHRRTNLEPGDILLTNCGASIGRVGITQDDPRVYRTTFQKSISVIKPDEAAVDGKYLYYFLLANSSLLIQLGDGTAQPNLLIGDLKRIQVPIPPRPVQRKIASSLSVYDDLIDNSHQRIRVLEGMARTVYRGWFVNEKLLNPKALGFERRAFGDLCDLVKTPFDEDMHGSRRLLDLARIPQRFITPLDTADPSVLTTSRIVFEPGDTLFGAIRCYLHKVVAAPFSGVTNTSVLVLRPKKPWFRSLTAIIASDGGTIRWAETHSAGTKMPVINWTVFQTMPIPMFNEDLVKRYESVAGPMFDQIGLLTRAMQNLRHTRDLLLPRLMPGLSANVKA